MAEHCANHEKNTEDISTMKGHIKALVWVAPIAATVAAAVCGYTLSVMNDNIKTVSYSVGRIELVVQQAAITAAANGTRLDYLEREVIKGHR
jgi:hypothetical protein